MNVLPIISRELRVRSRKRGTYWSRFAIALAGVVMGFPTLTSPWTAGAPGLTGQRLLTAVVGIGFLVSCFACLLTADVISSERREGTLGLLMLTRVGVFDVLIGKLGAAGLASLCALVAFLPVLMMPVLVGGVTGGEVVRKALVLPNTLFVALTAGLWASARGREWSRTALKAILLLVGIMIVPGLVEHLYRPSWKPGLLFGLASPLATMLSADNASYMAAPGQYWISLVLVHAVGWLLLLGAALRVRSDWRRERGVQSMDYERRHPGAPASGTAPSTGRPRAVPEAGVPGRVAKCAPLRDHTNPIAWLLRRQRGTVTIFWLLALLSLARFAYHWVLSLLFGRGGYLYEFPMLAAMEILLASLLAWAASRYFVDARRSGELELLLTTPLGTAQLVSTQWKLLRRWLRWPIVIMLAPLVFAAVITSFSRSAFAGAPPYAYGIYLISLLVQAASIGLEFATLCWVGMWLGFRAGTQARAIIGTLILAVGLPSVIEHLPRIAFFVLGPAGWFGYSWFTYFSLQAATLLCYLGLIRLSRRCLTSNVAVLEASRPGGREFVYSLGRDVVSAWRKARHWTPSGS